MLDQLANAVSVRPGRIAFVLVLATLVAAAGAVQLQFDDEPRTIFQTDDAEFAALEELFADFGSDDNDVVLVVRGDIFAPDNLSALRDAELALNEVDGVETVTSLFQLRRRGSTTVPLVPRGEVTLERADQARQRALEHPLAAGHLLSADARTTLLVVRLTGGSLPMSTLTPLVSAVRIAARDALQGSTLSVQLGGHPPVRIDSLVGLRRELVKSMALSAVVSLVIAWTLFRHWRSVIIVCLGPALSVFWTFGALGFLGDRINGVNNVIPPLIFVIGFADAVHLLSAIQRLRVMGQSPADAAANGVRELGIACILASLTTLVGFGSLAFSHTHSVRHLGIDTACGTICSLVTVILMTPLLARTVLGRDLAEPGSMTRAPGAAWLMALVHWVLNHYRAVTFISVTITLALGVLSVRLQPDIRWTEAIPAHSETSQALAACDAHFGGGLLASVVVEWPPEFALDAPEVMRTVDEVQRSMTEDLKLRGACSLLDVLDALPGADRAAQLREFEKLPDEALRRLVRSDRRRLVVTVRVPDSGAVTLKPIFEQLDLRLERIAAEHPGFRLWLTGTVVVSARNMTHIIADLRRSLIGAAVVIFVMMGIGLRSTTAALVSVVPNVFPLSVMAGLLLLTGEPLRITTALTFNVALGLAVNDTIHVLVRFRSERAAAVDYPTAIVRAYEAVGAPMLMSTWVLMAGFASNMLSDMPAIQQFGAWASAAMLAALLGDAVILPAMLRLCMPRSRE